MDANLEADALRLMEANAKGKEKRPKWRTPMWNRARLKALVRSHFGPGEIDISMLAIEGFGNPFDVLRVARGQLVVFSK